LCELRRFDEAEVVYRHAIDLNPELFKPRFELALMLSHQGKSAEAAEVYRALIAHEPGSLVAWFNLGNILIEQGAHGEGAEAYRRVISLDPGFAAAYRNLALALRRDMQCDDALTASVQAMALEPENTDSHIVMGDVLLALDRVEEALDIYRQALARRPDDPKLHRDLAVALHRHGDVEAAVQSYRRAGALAPDDAGVLKPLGIVLHQSKRIEEALQVYRQAIALDPNDAWVFANMGVCLYDLGRLEEAVDAFQRALALDPKNAPAHNGLGFLYDGMDDLEAAIAGYRRAVASDPDFAQAYSNLGLALGNIGYAREGLVAARRAVELNPDNPLYHYNYAHSLLGSGDLANGFREYDWRIQYHAVHDGREVFVGQEWRGEPLDGRTLLLRAEYGLGDTLQFVRYVPQAAAMGGRVVLQVPSHLTNLLRGCYDATGVTVVTCGEPLPSFDLHLPLMSLPRIFGTTLDSIPADVPYLFADPAKSLRWRAAMARSPRLKVGVSWAGNPTHHGDRKRSLPAEAVLPHLLVPGVQLFSLQKEPRETDRPVLEALRGEIVDLAPALRDFSDTAAAVSALDLVIAVDTSVAQLAGAFGRPTWVMLPYALDWRWLRDREDSPWYPTLRLFRQHKPGDWASVIERLPGELARVVAGERHLLLPPNSDSIRSA
jgi:tetratricopeptide (TPR) repeat protein